ncbi:hypothetical protein QQ020_25100 [Fulvivirgaceae bacterium BMA12]|uniref:Lipoprotein n=1 Tax=Agaribacillus aureus TaxID=3051825 RepID=A0ABT8LE83_9BACT|nr:hypothetical protein [Fulvivirgaceae bacterium BMA12]
MMRHPHMNYPAKIAKWLLAITMLFSLSAYSGYAGCSQKPSGESVKTELVIARYQNVAKPVSSRYFQTGICKTKVVAGFYQHNFCLASLIYSQLFIASFNTFSKEAFCIRQPKNFHTQKTIPQSSEEEPTHLFRG